MSNSTSSPLAVLTPIETVTGMPPERIACTELRNRSAISFGAPAADAWQEPRNSSPPSRYKSSTSAMLAHLGADVAEDRVAAGVAVAVVDALNRRDRT